MAERSREARGPGAKWWVLTILLTALLLLGLRWVPRLLTSKRDSDAEMRKLKSLSERIAVLEKQAGHTPHAVVVIDGYPNTDGISGITGEFASSGGEVTLIATGAASTRTPGAVLEVNVQLDGRIIGTLRTGGAKQGQPRPFPTGVFAAGTLPRGSHTVRVTPANSWTVTGADDTFSVTAVESGRSSSVGGTGARD